MTNTATEVFEREVLNNPSSVKSWLQLVRSVQASEHQNKIAEANAVNVIYERAIRANGYSYKLWMHYILYRRKHVGELLSAHEWFRGMRSVYDRALEKLPMMPLLWESFLDFAMNAPVPPRITIIRHAIIGSLQVLPVTQHRRIWKLTRQWIQRPCVPAETAKYLWNLFLLFERNGSSQRDYFAMLWEKTDVSDALEECSRFLLNGHPHNDLLGDMNFWEMIRMALLTKGLRFEKDFDMVEKMVDLAVGHCASPTEFNVAYAVFLMGQGEFGKARKKIRVLLEETDDARVFSQVFSVAISMEDEIVDLLVMDPSIQSLHHASFSTVCKRMQGDVSDPLGHILTLLDHYPLLLNQLKLRIKPRDVATWLKRVELFQEMACNGKASIADVSALFLQAITQCTSGLDAVDASVAQLYESYASHLWENERKTEAIIVARDGAWYVDFSNSTSNMILMGLQVEFMLLTNPIDSLKVLLSGLEETSLPMGTRSRGLVKSTIVQHLRMDSRAWILAIDLAFFFSQSSSLQGSKGDEIEQIIPKLVSSGGFTPECASYLAGRFWHNGQREQAFREFERALVVFKENHISILFLLHQYLSCLCLSFEENLPLYRLRELTRVGLDLASTTLHSSPTATVEFLMNCVALESRLGLFGNAINVSQRCLELVLEHCQNETLSISLLDTVLDTTLRLQGTQSVVLYCAKLLERRLNPQLIQRVAIWWAAVEKRLGSNEKAYAVMEACCKSQNPRSSHGIIFWSLWESICGTVELFEQVHKRKQQVLLRYEDAAATSKT